jgi:TolB protein
VQFAACPRLRKLPRRRGIHDQDEESAMRAMILAAWSAACLWFCASAAAQVGPPQITNRLENDAPSVVSFNTRVTLSWAASADYCTYQGSSFPAGVTFPDWPLPGNGGAVITAPDSDSGPKGSPAGGGTACSTAAACAATHTNNFFLSRSGNYRFQISCYRGSTTQPVTSAAVIRVLPEQVATADGVAANLNANTPGPLHVGQLFEYLSRVSNKGSATFNQTTEVTLPPELEFVPTGCGSTDANGRVVRWSVELMQPGSAQTCRIGARLTRLPSGNSIEAKSTTRFTINTTEFTLATSETLATQRRSRALSLTRTGAPTTQDSVAPVLSGDGSVLVFSTRQRGLADDDSNAGGADIVLKNRRDGSAKVVSVRSTDGVALRGDSSSPALSANGRAIAFIYQPQAARPEELKAGELGQLCASPPNGLFRPTCTTTAPNGQPLSGPAESPSMSADGKLMAFCSRASNWVSGDNNLSKDVFVMDMTTSAVILVSRDAAGNLGNGDSCDPAISGNGKYVAFRTRAPLLGGTEAWQVVRKNLEDGSIERLSQSAAGAPASADAGRPSISYNGRRVTFASSGANLVAGLTAGIKNVYVAVSDAAGAGISFGDVTAGDVRPKGVGNGLFGVRPSSGAAPNGDAGDPSISCNGQAVAFGSSASNLVSGDTGGMADVFIYDLESDVLRRAQATNSGAEANGPSDSPSISCDGGSLVFQSGANNVDASDPNTNTDIYAQDDPRNVNGTPAQLGSQFSGNWYNPGQSGHGFLLEALPDGRYYLTWYLYVDGNPLFLQGVATPNGNTLSVPVYSTRSTAFPVGPAVQNSNWGTLRMVFTDADTAAVEWQPTTPGFTSGGMTLRRLTAPALPQADTAGTPIKACYSGIWYDPARSGFGFNLEVIEQGDSRAIVTYWYTYKPDGSPLWLTGVARPARDAIEVDLYQGGGSGAQFPFEFMASGLSQTRWGSATLRFTGDNTLQVAYQPVVAGYVAGGANLSRLTELAGRTCGGN